MSNRNDILNELREIAPRLALLEKTNFYKVPDGYFVDFQKGILQKVALGEVRAELTEIAPQLSKLNKQLVADMPANYFSGLSSELINKIRATEVKNELLEIAPELSKLQKANAYAVPATYFNSFAGDVLSQIKAEEKPQQSFKNSPLVIIENAIGRLFAPLFKPKYSVPFAGFATLVIVGMLYFVKPVQCADIECRLAQLSNEDINAYLENHPNYNSEQIFDEAPSNLSAGTTDFAVYKEALKDVDDASLSEAIMD